MAVLPGRYEALRQVEPDPFERLFIAEYSRVVAIAHRVLGDGHEAEDVAQEVFASFHGRHPPEANFASAWLHSAAVHIALNVVRGKRRRALREELNVRSADRLAQGSDALLDPQRAIEAEERRREVRAALGRLPARSAAALVLRYSGLSYAEVAAALHVGIGQVGTLLRRGEIALRKEMSRATH